MPALETPKLYRASKAKTSNVSSQAFKVVHQKVAVDIDVNRHAIAGTTEIVVVPTIDKLKVIRVDCREMAIDEVRINGKPCTFIYDDHLYLNDQARVETGQINVFDLYSANISMENHHLIRKKLSKVFGEVNFDPRELAQLQHQLTQQLTTSGEVSTPLTPVQQQQVQNQLQQHQSLFLQHFTTSHTNTGELAIVVPDSIKFDVTDGSVTPMSVPGTTPMKKNTHNESYAPITIQISYKLVNPKNGVVFVTSDPDPSKWYCFTANPDLNISTSSWVPSIDNYWERNTWSSELSVPRTFQTTAKDDDDDEESGDLDVVVCCGDNNNVKETPHPTDESKKIVSWSLFTPVCAHHVGWVFGCFDSFVLKADEVMDEEEDSGDDPDTDDEDGELTKVEAVSNSVTVYCSPEQMEWAKNTCVVSNRALDYFSKEFGSFPFSSYSLVFIDGVEPQFVNFAGLSIVNSDVLYPADVIEPMIPSTEVIVEAIATQWSGINIVPHSYNDLWCVIGIARYMMFQYLRVLMGNNEYKFRIKMAVEEICQKDVHQKPLALQFFRFPVRDDPKDLWFVRLKAPIVMICLDRRMTKTDKSFGLSRVLPKLFLQAMSGDLVNGSLSTHHFQYVCEKVNRTNKLEGFFKQWIYGAGTPRFYVTQRFNKKRFLIEMNIRQVQTKEVSKYKPTPEKFVQDGLAYVDNEPAFPTQPVFTGPMTIRVHEQDGTPYEHIVDLKESNTRIDIQYNTKMRRKMKSRKNKDNPEEDEEEVAAPAPQLGATFTPLGQEVLRKPSEMAEWGFENWSKTEEELFDNAFEWVRVDADLEWIAQFEVKMPDYMYGSQLSFDRDVEAQYDAIKYFGHVDRPVPQVYTSLVRTLMDDAYYYGVRVAAARALVTISNEGNQFLGVGYMIKAYKEMYCYPNSSIPKSNDFNDFGRFYVQKAIPGILANVRTDAGEVPRPIKTLLFNLVKYNDNSNNQFQDSFYLADLLSALTTSALPPTRPESDLNWLTDPSPGIGNDEHRQFVENVNTEILRLQKLDEWIPSFHNVMSVACLHQRTEMASRGLMALSLEDLLFYTLEKYPTPVRLEAWRGVFLMGGLRNASVLKYFGECVLLASDANATSHRLYQHALVQTLLMAISVAAIDGTRSSLDDPEFGTIEKLAKPQDKEVGDSVVIENADASQGRERRRDELAKASIKGVINLLRRDYGPGVGLRELLWQLMHSSLMSISCRRDVFNMCQLLYPVRDEYIVKLQVPSMPVREFKKKIVAKSIGEGQIVIRREGRFKISLMSRKPVVTNSIKLRGTTTTVVASQLPALSREERASLREAQLNKQAPAPVVTYSIGPRKVAVNGTMVSLRLNKKILSSIKPRSGVSVISDGFPSVVIKFHGNSAKRFRSRVTKRIVKINVKTGTVEVERKEAEDEGNEVEEEVEEEVNKKVTEKNDDEEMHEKEEEVKEEAKDNDVEDILEEAEVQENDERIDIVDDSETKRSVRFEISEIHEEESEPIPESMEVEELVVAEPLEEPTEMDMDEDVETETLISNDDLVDGEESTQAVAEPDVSNSSDNNIVTSEEVKAEAKSDEPKKPKIKLKLSLKK